MTTADHVVTRAPTGLWSVSAVELGRAYGARQLSPVEVLEAILARCESVNPRLNAIVTLDVDGARQAARESEARWRRGEALGALDGVPLTVKDNIPVGGLRTTWGSRLLADYVPTQDELPVARLRAQGAVIIGKTNVPEFTLQGYTHNALFGTTRNPWDPAPDAGRIERRRGCGGCGGARSAGHRHRRRRLHPPAGGPCRARRPQAFDRARRARRTACRRSCTISRLSARSRGPRPTRRCCSRPRRT